MAGSPDPNRPNWPPCGAPNRDAACLQWALGEQKWRDVYQTAPFKCQLSSVQKATDCCLSACRTGEDANSCLLEAGDVLRDCHPDYSGSNDVSKDCFSRCVAASAARSGPCYWPCRLCSAVASLDTLIACAVGSFIAFLPVPFLEPVTLPGAFLSCLAGAALVIDVSCPMCGACLLANAATCAEECDYGLWGRYIRPALNATPFYLV